MIKIMLVSPENVHLTNFEQHLKRDGDVEVIQVKSGEIALRLVAETTFDLAVTDENLGDMTNLEFAQRLIKINPMINCASVSNLSSNEFHEASEGLGIMCQLSFPPGKEDAEKLLETLRSIKKQISNIK